MTQPQPLLRENGGIGLRRELLCTRMMRCMTSCKLASWHLRQRSRRHLSSAVWLSMHMHDDHDTASACAARGGRNLAAQRITLHPHDAVYNIMQACQLAPESAFSAQECKCIRICLLMDQVKAGLWMDKVARARCSITVAKARVGISFALTFALEEIRFSASLDANYWGAVELAFVMACEGSHKLNTGALQ